MLGKCWNSDVGKNQILNFPEMDPAKGDVDNFSALTRLVDELIKFDSLVIVFLFTTFLPLVLPINLTLHTVMAKP